MCGSILRSYIYSSLPSEAPDLYPCFLENMNEKIVYFPPLPSSSLVCKVSWAEPSGGWLKAVWCRNCWGWKQFFKVLTVQTVQLPSFWSCCSNCHLLSSPKTLFGMILSIPTLPSLWNASQIQTSFLKIGFGALLTCCLKFSIHWIKISQTIVPTS